MKILMLVNWKIKYSDDIPDDLQSPDYYSKKEKYWFYKYFSEEVQVDVIDISSFKALENIEKNILHFYILQALKAIFKLKKYDLVVSHGMQSGILIALFRSFFKTKAKHIVFDIGSFNSAKETGKILKLNQFASKSIDGIIYHEREQLEYYKKCFPWIIKKSKFIPFGADVDYFEKEKKSIEIKSFQDGKYIISIGYKFRDNETLEKAFKKCNIKNCKLKIIGSVKEKKEEGNIQYYPPISKSELNKEIQNALFCILPLDYMNFSFGQMTLLQQMYYGKIVITADVPSVRDYIINGKTGILYKHKDSEDLKNKIEYVFNNYNNLQDISNAAKKSVDTQFNEKNMAKNVEEFLKKIDSKER